MWRASVTTVEVTMGTRHYTHELYVTTLRYLLRDGAEEKNLAETWHRRKAAHWFAAPSRFSAMLSLQLASSARYWTEPKG